jgi:hypothetical protein
MKYKVLTQLSTAKPGWFQCLTAFTEKHLRQEVRSSLKAKALNLITKICLANMSIYEEDLIDKIILPHMKNLENDGDPAMRQSGVKFVLDFLMESSSKKGHNLLRILEKVEPFYPTTSCTSYYKVYMNKIFQHFIFILSVADC